MKYGKAYLGDVLISDPAPERLVKFYDYDGTVLYEYTVEEARALKAMPVPPAQNKFGIPSDGWNFTLEELQNLEGPQNIGVQYKSDNTVFGIHLDAAGEMTFGIQGQGEGNQIDWGDGTIDTLTYSSSYKKFSHNYATGGDYIVKFIGVSAIPKMAARLAPSRRSNKNSSLRFVITRAFESTDNQKDIISLNFAGCENLAEVIISSGKRGNLAVTGDGFKGCMALKHLTLPRNAELYNIASYYMAYTGLKTLSFGGNYTAEIDGRNFFDYTYLENFYCPQNATLIGYYLKVGGASLKHAFIPKGVSSFSNGGGSNFFAGSPLLKEVYGFEDTIIETLPAYMFQACSSLEKIKLSPAVKTLGSCLFNQCTALREVTIPEGVTTIPQNCFALCLSLATIVLPSTVTKILANAFANSGIVEISLAVGQLGASAFYNCQRLTKVSISGLSIIPSGAFQYCANLMDVSLAEDHLTQIAQQAFAYCTSLAEITIPSTVTSIGNQCFSGCDSLMRVHVKATTPPTLGSNVFGSFYADDFKIYVPVGTLAEYKSATNWSYYAQYMEEESE